MNKAEFKASGYTCAVYKGDEIVFTSYESGIKPLLYIIDNNIDVRGCFAIDKIVGRAAAMLYSYMGVSAVYAEVMSSNGLDILTENNIIAEYETLTEKIINRRGTDICPMEKAVADIDSPERALFELKKKVWLSASPVTVNTIH